MKYCTHCGAQICDEAVVCTKCGCVTINFKNVSNSDGSDKWNGLAIAGFVVSFFVCVVGLVLSIIAYIQTNKSCENGKGLALAGIIISSILIGMVTLYYLIYFGIFFLFTLPYTY